MRRKNATLGTWLAVLCLAAAVPAVAQGMGDRPGRTPVPRRPEAPPLWADGMEWWNNPEMVEQLGLEEATRRKIDDEVYRARSEMIDLRADVEKQNLELERMLGPDGSVALPAVEAQVDRLVAARGAVLKSEIMLRARIMNTLSPEQRAKLEQIHQNRRQRMRERVFAPQGKAPTPPLPDEPEP